MELYNKYRPKSFDDILGNDSAIKSIKSELENGHKTFLFVAEKGCGKTSSAECVANYLGCSDLNIREMNASNDRGIDAIRKIGEEIRYTPINGEKLVYIIDECHRLTGESQDCFLRIVESAPDWVYFLFCTTNPEKLIEALRSRCSVIKFKPLDDDTMLRLLRIIAHKEGVSVSLDVLKMVVSESEGSARNGIKRLGQILYLENDEERVKFLKENVFSLEKAEIIELCRALLNQEGWSKYMECLDKLKNELSSNAEGVRQSIMGYAYAVLKKGMKPSAVGMIQVFSNVDCYKNGKNGIMVGILDFQDYMQG